MISMCGKVISLVTFPASAMTAVCVFGSTFAVAEGVSLATQKKVKVPGTTGTQTRLVGSEFFKELSGAHLACVQPLWKFGAAPYRYLGSALLGGTKHFVRPTPKPYHDTLCGYISSKYDANKYAEDLRKNVLGVSPNPFPGNAGVSQLCPSAGMPAKAA